MTPNYAHASDYDVLSELREILPALDVTKMGIKKDALTIVVKGEFLPRDLHLGLGKFAEMTTRAYFVGLRGEYCSCLSSGKNQFLLRFWVERALSWPTFKECSHIAYVVETEGDVPEAVREQKVYLLSTSKEALAKLFPARSKE